MTLHYLIQFGIKEFIHPRRCRTKICIANPYRNRGCKICDVHITGVFIGIAGLKIVQIHGSYGIRIKLFCGSLNIFSRTASVQNTVCIGNATFR